jgi:hypothetical protein
MPTHATRYEGQVFSENGRLYHFKIYDKDYSGPTYSLTVGGGGIKIKYGASGQGKFSPIIASKCTISLIVEASNAGNHFTNFISRLRDDYEEGDATLVIWNTVDTAAPPLWSGNILIDLSAKEDISQPYEIELSATDGIGLLKNYDMVATQGSSPYEVADTYVSDGYQTFIYWIKTILEYCNTPDSDSTDGDVADYTFSTSVNWWYDDHPSPTTSISPLAYTELQMLGAYKLTKDSLYNVKSVYDILEAICKMWGMRVVFWSNRFYFTQLELYNTAETGTFAVPDNIDSQIWTRAGALSSGRAYLGEPDYTAYSQDIETNAGGFTGGLQKLAGSKWDYYPKLKEVSTEFASVGDNNYYQSFPQPSSSTTPNANDLITSTPLGTIKGASALGGFNLNINLEFATTTLSTADFTTVWSIRAKPSADSNFANGYYLPNMVNNPTSWEAWPGVGSQEFSALASGYTSWNCWMFLIDLFQNNWLTMSLTPTAQFNLFSGTIPTDSHFTGDWDFEIFTYATYMNHGGGLATGGEYVGHMGYIWGSGLTTYDFRTDITYSDVLDVNGFPTSQFNCIYSNTIGGNIITTNVYSSRTETQKVEIKDIYWGDTPVSGDPNALIWTDDVGGSGYTSSAGKWRNGQTGTFNKTITELLCEAVLFNQQQSDGKWSLSTVVSETKDVASDGTTTRPVYINPIGRIHDTVENIFYYILRGTFDITTDGWSGEWVEISLNASISTTTSTTTTGGSTPNTFNIAARLSAPSTGSARPVLRLTTLRTSLAAGAITSLPIYALKGDLAVPSETNIIKTGDKIILRNESTFHEFEASADVADTDTTISVVSTTTIIIFPIFSNIELPLRDLYQQYQHQD